MRKLTSTLAVAVSMALFASNAGADVVASYDFEGASLTDNVASIDSDGSAGTAGVGTGWSTSDLLDGAINVGTWATTTHRNINTDNSTDMFGVSSWRSDSTIGAGAVGYVSTTVSPDSFTQMDFTGFSATTDAAVDQTGSGFLRGDYTLSYSVNGGTFVSLGTVAGPSRTGSGTTTATGLSWDLSAIGVIDGRPTQGDDSIEFRLDAVRAFGTNSTVGTRRFSIDNFTINADAIAVPEPSTLALAALIGVAGIGCVVRRRRKKA